MEEKKKTESQTYSNWFLNKKRHSTKIDNFLFVQRKKLLVIIQFGLNKCIFFPPSLFNAKRPNFIFLFFCWSKFKWANVNLLILCGSGSFYAFSELPLTSRGISINYVTLWRWLGRLRLVTKHIENIGNCTSLGYK
jgi:hypothetical protein